MAIFAWFLPVGFTLYAKNEDQMVANFEAYTSKFIIRLLMKGSIGESIAVYRALVEMFEKIN